MYLTLAKYTAGHLVGTGKECDFIFNAPPVKFEAPCNKPLLLAFEGQDIEWSETEASKKSKAGFVAEIRWCGRVILTNRDWKCSTVADNLWQTPNWQPAKSCGSDHFQKALTENHTCGELSGKCGDGHEADAKDNTQALRKHINPAAKWIWSGNDTKDFVHVDSAYCRIELDCQKDSCNETIPTSQGCVGPGGSVTPGYTISHLSKEATQFSSTGLMRPEELGALSCAPGYAARRPIIALCPVWAAESDSNASGFEYDGCCPHFLWTFKSTNWGVGGMAFMLMTWVFVAFHIVCDDFFVPALNVMCETVGLSDDIAGATFMAAGASSPELFASLIGVLTYSAVGAGTVVGSELFNMLVIIGGVCLVTPKPLLLDWRPLCREVFFFSLSLIMILVVLSDSEVEMSEALALLCGYALYVLVCAKFKPIVHLCCPLSETDEGGMNADLLYEDIYAKEAEQLKIEAEADLAPLGSNQIIGDANTTVPITISDSINSGASHGSVLAHGFLFKKSVFHSKARNTSSIWQQRWMVLDNDSFRYVRKNGKERVIVAGASDWAECSVMTVSYTEFILVTPTGDRARVTFKAAKPIMTRQWVKALSAHIADCRKMSEIDREEDNAKHKGEEENTEHAHNILAKPEGGFITIGMYYATFPIMAALKYTVPDVRNPKHTKLYPVTMLLSVVWLAILAEFMMNSAESCGCIAGVAEDIMGLTVTAAGTSLPNLFASIIVAKQGLGNMSVSNAFGSNTFNIFIALALPWLIGGIREGLSGGPYSYHVPKGNIFISCKVLGLVLVFIVASIVGSNMRLTKALGWPFMAIYLLIIIGLIANAN